jgi:hypothetical protein
MSLDRKVVLYIILQNYTKTCCYLNAVHISLQISFLETFRLRIKAHNWFCSKILCTIDLMLSLFIDEIVLQSKHY